MLLSVIIPTRNRSALLGNALASLTGQTLSPREFEVIVVDNGSDDDTAQVVEGFRGKLEHLRYFYEEAPGLHVGRHRGLQEAASEILVYADDDIEAFDTWLAGFKDSFQDKDIVLAGGKCLPKFETPPPPWLMKRWEDRPEGDRYLGYLSIIDLGDRMKTDPPAIFGCNYALRKKTLLEVGGFHPDSMPQSLLRFRGDGESWVSRAVAGRGLKSVYNPDASVYHCIPKGRLTFDYFQKRAYAQGISDSYAQIRYPHSRETLKDKIKRLEIALKRSVKRMLFIDRESVKLERIIAKAYKAGFSFHQKEVKNDPELLQWVLKENYFQ
ncbi:MAG: glycosyltransferase [bacterium]|nr:glycosyltransferase [bacterium]